MKNFEIAGLKNSHFTNPSGLHHDDHYASALRHGEYVPTSPSKRSNLKKLPLLKAITQKRRNVRWKNKHRLLHDNELAIAGKTGYTKRAGRTLVTYFKKDEKEIVVVTLNHSNDWTYSYFPCRTSICKL